MRRPQIKMWGPPYNKWGPKMPHINIWDPQENIWGPLHSYLYGAPDNYMGSPLKYMRAPTVRGMYFACPSEHPPHAGTHFINIFHDDVIKWKHFPRCWPFVREILRSPVNSPHKCQWRGALMFSLTCAWINGWVNYREAGDLRRHRAHYGVTVMFRFDFMEASNKSIATKFCTWHDSGAVVACA